MEKKLLTTRKHQPRGSGIGIRHGLMLAVLMGVAVVAGAASFYLQHEGNAFPSGWHIAGVDASGLSPSEVRQRLEQFARAWERVVVTVEARTQDDRLHWHTQATRKQLGASLDVEATLNHAWRQATQHSPLLRIVLGWVRRQTSRDVQPVVHVDTATLQTWLQKYKRDIEVPPRDARIRYIAAGRWQILPEERGIRLTSDAIARLKEALQRSDTLCLLPLEEASPRITSQHLQPIDSEWTVASTRYSERERNRSYNIRKAADSINGIVLLPGDEFSYNRVVGPRTLKEGFRRAPVIVKGELVSGDGGGVCQVSTTVYIAALQAGLHIVQRSKHAFPIGYAPPGLDATVVYGAIDLRFRNNTPSPIALVAEAKRGRMIVRVLGSSTHKRHAQIQRIVHAVLPAPVKTFPTDKLPAGMTRVINKGQRGWRVSVYRVITEPGKPPVREKVVTDYYRPQPKVVLVGQGQSEQKTPSATPSVLPTDAQ